MTSFLSDIISGIINNIDSSLTVDSVSGNAIIFEDLKYIGLFNYLIKVNGSNVSEISIKSVNRTTREVTFDVAVGTFTEIHLPGCYFLAGTRYATNREWVSASDREQDKLPLIWLHF